MNSRESTILVIDDSPSVREMIATVLRRGGYQVLTASGGEDGLRVFAGRRPDLVVLDLHMPGMDGWTVLERLREMTDRPVLMLTGAGDERSRVQGLVRGADDYVVKPASAAELLARVLALLRRAGRPDGAVDRSVYDDGLVRVDFVARTVHVAGRELSLTPLEFKLLVALVRRPRVTVSKEELMREVWNDTTGGPSDHVKLYVGYLRRKLAQASSAELIETVRGFGYRWPRASQGGGDRGAPRRWTDDEPPTGDGSPSGMEA